MYLGVILILFEAKIMREIIKNAILKKLKLKFIYKGYNRIFEPHVFGMTIITSKDFIRGWQSGGGSSKKDVPGWKMFYLEYIENIELIEVHFIPQETKHDVFKDKTEEIYSTVKI